MPKVTKKERERRKSHIGAAIDRAGGNRVLAREISSAVGQHVREQLPAQWRCCGYVPAKYHALLTEFSGGYFKPEILQGKTV